MKFSYFLVSLILFSAPAFAFEEGQIRAGLQTGHVGLMQDVGNRSGNALGWGALVGYSASDEMTFEVGYLASSHTGLTHNQLNTGLVFYFNSYDAAHFSLLGGVDFISHSSFNTTSSGFALYGGLGVDFELGKRLGLGLVGIYNHAFETTVIAPDGTTQKSIQPFMNVLLRVIFFFDGKS